MIIDGSGREEFETMIEVERISIEEIDIFIDKINAAKATKKTGK